MNSILQIKIDDQKMYVVKIGFSKEKLSKIFAISIHFLQL